MGHLDQITDTDFFNYLGVTSRAQKNDFEARLETLKDVIKVIGEQKKIPQIHQHIASYHTFLIKNKFKDIVTYFISGKKHE